MNIVSKEALEQLFLDKTDNNSFDVISNCCACGTEIKVTVERTSDGFGLLGGMLYRSDHNGLAVKCPDCVGIELESPSTV